MHALVIDETGGRHGVRDVGLLQAACARPFTTIGGALMFPSVIDRAAVLFDSFARYHVFTDGNKRTAIIVCARYLSLYDMELRAGHKELVRFAIRVVEKHPDISQIASWLQQRAE